MDIRLLSTADSKQEKGLSDSRRAQEKAGSTYRQKVNTKKDINKEKHTY